MSSKKAGVRRRRQHSADLKARVALEAIQERRTLNEIASEHGVHPTQVPAWKRQALESLSAFFGGGLRVDGPELKRQRLQRRYTLANQEYRSPELSQLVTAWRYPLHFIDFETSRIAVPYFHPRMKGRLSIKQVLPAAWESNSRLHVHPTFARYYRRDASGQPVGPYLTLPALPFGASSDEHDEVVKDGGGAMRAYQEMMYGLSKDDAAQRENWKRLLLQYCELDTAAMVMIWLQWADPVPVI
jgi:transposase-like protein